MGVARCFCNVVSRMEQEQLLKLIDKYLAGNCSAHEARIVEQWYESHQHTNKDFYGGENEAIRQSEARSLSAIRSKLGMKEETSKLVALNAEPEPLQKRRIRAGWLVAASVLVLFTIAAVLYLSHTGKPETYTVVQTPTGKLRHIKLPDGTAVWLNAGTTLKYSSSFNKSERKVHLDGEAFFDVVHDKNKPFDIHSGKIKTHVLGTAFSVSSYANSLISNITVVRGKVQVSDSGRVLAELLPNQALEYSPESRKASVINVDAEKVVAWKTGKLIFIDMPMQDIALHLQKWYGINFVFKNQQLKNTRFTASFNNNISLEDLLAIMFEVSHMPYRIDAMTKTVIYL
jgi:transmembrane sensor